MKASQARREIIAVAATCQNVADDKIKSHLLLLKRFFLVKICVMRLYYFWFQLLLASLLIGLAENGLVGSNSILLGFKLTYTPSQRALPKRNCCLCSVKSSQSCLVILQVALRTIPSLELDPFLGTRQVFLACVSYVRPLEVWTVLILYLAGTSADITSRDRLL